MRYPDPDTKISVNTNYFNRGQDHTIKTAYLGRHWDFDHDWNETGQKTPVKSATKQNGLGVGEDERHPLTGLKAVFFASQGIRDFSHSRKKFA